MRILYVDCFSGISGDMAVGALIDAGADATYISQELKKMKLEPFELSFTRVVKQGISAVKFDVIVDQNHPPQHHRKYAEIIQLIQASEFSERVKAISLAIFKKIGAAEAKIHQIPMDDVHFHEVGAIDSIADIIAIACALEQLDIEKIYASPVPLGSGIVSIDHGNYPIPAPATLEMMRGIPIASSTIPFELTTPTGAGFISALCEDFTTSIPPMIIESIGYGAGTRDLKGQPNVLRVVIGEMDSSLEHTFTNHHDHHHHDHHHHDHDHHHHDHHHHDHHHHDHDHHDHDHHHHDHYHKNVKNLNQTT